MSLLIHGASVVTSLDPAAIQKADVLVTGGRIEAVATSLAGDHAQRLDASGCLLVPGSVNAHMHAYSSLARGMPYSLASPTTFLEILQRVWWRLDRALDREMIRASALVAARDALLAGTTTLVDHHASPSQIGGSLDVIADAFEELGLRSVLAYEVSDRDGPERAAEGLAENRRFIHATADGARPLTRAMVGAHASFTLSDTTLEDCAALGRASRTGVHIHVDEDRVDEDDAMRRSNRHVIERLIDARALNHRSLLAHAVHVDQFGAELIREASATVVHNPRSNMNNAVGRPPLDALGKLVALGTDGIGADMFAEAQVAYLRRHEELPSASPEWALGRLACGTRFAGGAFDEPLLGAVAPGAPGDLVVLDYPSPTPIYAQNVASHWIFGITSAAVRDVIVNGELVVRERQLTRFDGRELSAQAVEQANRLWRRLGDIDVHPFTPPRAPVGAGRGS